MGVPNNNSEVRISNNVSIPSEDNSGFCSRVTKINSGKYTAKKILNAQNTTMRMQRLRMLVSTRDIFSEDTSC